MKKIWAHFSQVGGANALLPLFDILGDDFEINYSARSMVCKFLRSKEHRALDWKFSKDSDLWKNKIQTELGIFSPDILITDTIDLHRSNEGTTNLYLWSLAKKKGIPTIAYVDAWWAYKSRFTYTDRICESDLPDVIAVIDSYARNAMISEGFAAEKIRILGSPQYGYLKKWINQVDNKYVEKIKSSAGIPPGNFLITFISQPFEKTMGSVDKCGLSEKLVLSELLRALNRLTRPFIDKLTLYILLHPEENYLEIKEIIDRERPNYQYKVSQGEETHIHIVVASNVVTGMSSILLSEAVVLQKPVISMLPNLKVEDVLITNLVGATTPVNSYEEISSVINNVTMNLSYRKALLEQQQKFVIITDAYNRWCGQINELTNS